MRRICLYAPLIIAWLLAASYAAPLASVAWAQELPAGSDAGPSQMAATVTSTSFLFQGKLNNGAAPVNGVCDLVFTLFDALQGGARIGDQITRPSLAVVDGIFQVSLDYGATAFQGERWLEISVRCPAGTGFFAVLAPRQPVQAVPIAITAANGPDGFTVFGDAWINGTGIFGAPGETTGISLRSPDFYMNADPSFGRGDGGRALVHDKNDSLHINMENDFSGGVWIDGKVLISGTTTIRNPLYINGNDIWLNGEASRGDGGRALVHFEGDKLYVNYGNDFSGGTVIDSDAHIVKDLTVAQDLTVEGNTIRLLGSDLYIRDDPRGDGGRALVHTTGDTLAINYDGDFAGGVAITNLRTGGIVEENLMTPAQRQQAALPGFSQGDVLCWDASLQQLAKCSVAASPLVVAVADAAGRPLVLGVEPVKVMGAVAAGDLLVAASQPGYAQSWPSATGEPRAGTILGKALESNQGADGVVMALIQLQ